MIDVSRWVGRCAVHTWWLSTAVWAQSPSWLPSSPFPSWGANGPQRVVTLAFDPSQSAAQNGGRLLAATRVLGPGDGLAIGPGTWVVDARFDISIVATAAQPIWLMAADPSQRPVITRSDASQNVLNIGSNAVSRYLVLQNLELTGGSDLLRIYDGSFTWVDGCYLHDGGGVGITAQTHPVSGLFITRCEVARPGPGTNGEALYLGGNTSALAVTDSVIAFNHVHDTRSARAGQGDGIELKDGSTRNWILGNRVHDCRNPCILVYGTNGVDDNVIDGNFLYDSDDAVLQVQGEALVRNNVAIGGSQAFQSHDHQGLSQNLRVVHNTLVSRGRGASLARWGGRVGMVLANNAIYSTHNEAIWFGIGDAGVLAAGNVIHGGIPGNAIGVGYRIGAGLRDFVGVDPVSLSLDVTPVVGGAIDNRGDPAFAARLDQRGAVRTLPVDPGAWQNAPTLTAHVEDLSWSGGDQLLTYAPGAGFAGLGYLLLASQSTRSDIHIDGFHVPLADDWLFSLAANGGLASVVSGGVGLLDAAGTARPTITLPPLDPSAVGLHFYSAIVVLDGGTVRHASNPQPLRIR